MHIKREIESELQNWKAGKNRKPLILRGARQVGKTTLINQFGKSYKNYIYLNLEKKRDRSFFEDSEDVETIMHAILLSNRINSTNFKDILLFIDEIQESPKVIQFLRYFYEEIPELHVVSAGSLLEFALDKIERFPVGRVEFMYLYPFNFLEFLNASDNELVKKEMDVIPIKDYAHSTLLEVFNKYAIIGGMPEVIATFAENNNYLELGKIYDSIWDSYKKDTEKYAKNTTEKKVLKHILETSPSFVDQRITFQGYGNSNYRSREVGEAFRDLAQAKIIQLVYPTTSLEFPIIVDFKKKPRLQFLDTGIINHALKITPEMLLKQDLSNSYKGAIIPHMITQELISTKNRSSYLPNFWVREKKGTSSEVDLVIAHNSKIIPIEIKSGKTGTLKSLHQFMDKVNHPYAIRIYAGKFEVIKTKTPNGTDYFLMNLPYYLGSKIENYIKYFVENFKME